VVGPEYLPCHYPAGLIQTPDKVDFKRVGSFRQCTAMMLFSKTEYDMDMT
jgi:hypothetical protein